MLDLIGTFVFALSGATAAVKRRLDLFGVLVLSFVAGNFGGITRDLLIGAVPPAAISDCRYLAVSLLAGVLTFCWFPGVDRWRNSVLLFDAGGLALFAVSGTQKALALGMNPVMASTARHGDGNRRRHGARCPCRRNSNRAARRSLRRAALAGAAVVVAGALLHIPSTATTIAGVALCFGLRLMAIRRGWQLPTARPRKHFEKEP
jgi:uncharacterized membrane protein YeiH